MSKSLPILGYPSTMGTGDSAAYPFDDMFHAIQVTPEDIRAGRVDAMVFWGGEDISTGIYDEDPHTKYVYVNRELGYRDKVEVPLMQAAIEMGVPIIGICRGAQLACAMSGGKLVQHVNGHGGGHMLSTYDGLVMRTSSVHHQMMWPFGMSEKDYQMLAVATNNRSNVYVFNPEDVRDEVEVEPEIIWFPKTKALAIQGHPEFMETKEEFVQYCRGLINKFILNNGENNG